MLSPSCKKQSICREPTHSLLDTVSHLNYSQYSPQCTYHTQVIAALCCLGKMARGKSADILYRGFFLVFLVHDDLSLQTGNL